MSSNFTSMVSQHKINHEIAIEHALYRFCGSTGSEKQVVDRHVNYMGLILKCSEMSENIRHYNRTM